MLCDRYAPRTSHKPARNVLAVITDLKGVRLTQSSILFLCDDCEKAEVNALAKMYEPGTYLISARSLL